MASQEIFLSLDHRVFAVMVVISMVSGGLILGAVLDFIMHRLGLQISAEDKT